MQLGLYWPCTNMKTLPRHVPPAVGNEPAAPLLLLSPSPGHKSGEHVPGPGTGTFLPVPGPSTTRGTAVDRSDDVRMTAVMLQGAVGQALRMWAGRWLHEAEVHQTRDSEDIPNDYDVVLRDGWRVRFTRSVIPPHG